VALLLALTAILIAAITWAPPLLVDVDRAGRSLDAVHRVEAIGQTRQMLLQAVGGLVVLLGAYVALRRLRVNEAELQVSREGQVTERFTRAVEQLGASSADVRIGGIYALERIARNSPTDRDAVIAIVSAFVRGHAPWPVLETVSVTPERDKTAIATLATRTNDVQSAVTVLGRVPRTAETEPPRLTLVDLRRARMWGLNFDGALFGISSLWGARLAGCSLVEADLGDCDLRDADLSGADLTGAMLWGADLTGADLTGAVLRETKFDARTRWPAGFDPQQHDTVLVMDPSRHHRRR
jgi:hypothetical protein